MIKLTKKLDMTFFDIIKEIERNIFFKREFFYSFKKSKRFAVPRNFIYDSREPEGDSNLYTHLSAHLLSIIDHDWTIVGWNPIMDNITTHYSLYVCVTTEKLIDAVKKAKKMNKPYVIDLQTGKLFKTNG